MNYSILLEDGSYLLQEDGTSHILTENYLYFDIQKSLEYLVQTSSNINLPLAYELLKGISKQLTYTVLTQHQQDKQLKYTIKTTLTPNLSLKYTVATSKSLSKNLKYQIIKTLDQTKDLKYLVKKDGHTNKTIVYALITTKDTTIPVTYGIVLEKNISKTAQYRIYGTIKETLNLHYAVDYHFQHVLDIRLSYHIKSCRDTYVYNRQNTNYIDEVLSPYYLLDENGSYLLLEDFGKIILDSGTKSYSNEYNKQGTNYNNKYEKVGCL